MADSSNKRKANDVRANGAAKKQKKWQTPKQVALALAGKDIHPGDAGIWVTCDRGREGKAAAEILDLFGEYAPRFSDSSNATENVNKDDDSEDEPSDIEQAVSSELSDMKKVKSKSLFTIIRPDIDCVLFVKTKPPIDPVILVHSICTEMATGKFPKRCRFIKRLTPASSTEKAQERNFEDLAVRILEPVFHGENASCKKFAIRYSARNHNILKRDEVIKQTASLVGNAHKVDLDHPDVFILIEIYKNICTMAVVEGDYNSLKKYNLSEIEVTAVQASTSDGSRFIKSTDNPTRSTG